MATSVVVIVYVLIGCGAAVAVITERLRFGGQKGPGGALMMLVLWPLFLPSMLSGGPIVQVLPSERPSARRLETLLAEVREAWRRANPGDPREEELVGRYGMQLRKEEQRLYELETSLGAAPARVRPQLILLKAEGDASLEQGMKMLEELTGQLLLLHFAGAKDGPDRISVEDLLARIEALAKMG